MLDFITFLIILINSNIVNNLHLQVAVYHLNADFDYRQMLDYTRLDPDCLHTVDPPRPMPKQVITIFSIIIIIITAFEAFAHPCHMIKKKRASVSSSSGDSVCANNADDLHKPRRRRFFLLSLLWHFASGCSSVHFYN